MPYQSKDWCFTLNHYNDDDVSRIIGLESSEDICYLVCGREIGESGTPHYLQGFVQLRRKKTLAGVKALFGSSTIIDLERRRGTPEEAAEYCKKHGDWFEFGTLERLLGSGHRSDLAAMREEDDEKAWNVASDDLKSQVLQWAENNLARCKRWILELNNLEISSSKTLKEWCADRDAFLALINGVSVALWVKIKAWAKEKCTNTVTDISGELYEELTKPFDEEPKLHQLEHILASDLLVQIPLHSANFQAVIGALKQRDVQKFENFFRLSDEEAFDLDHLLVELARMTLDLDYEGESALHYYVDLFMKRILKGILHSPFFQIEVARNITENSHTTGNRPRPDFLFYVNSFLILRGEEKRHKGELMEAVLELGDQLKAWNSAVFHKLHYIFGFACAGESFVLCAISPSGIVSLISRIYDLREVCDRFDLFISIVNLARVIRTISHRIPKVSMMMYRPIIRPNGVSIELRDDIIVKRIPISTLEWHEKFEFLEELYSAMLRNAVPCVVQCMNIEKCSKRRGNDRFIELDILPHGYQVIPPTSDLLIVAISCILRALEGVHKLGYAHRDIRWPNVLHVSDQEWILNDFENSCKGNDDLFQQDIRMVGKLVDSFEVCKGSIEISHFRDLLISDSPPNASDALALLDNLSNHNHQITQS